MSNLGGMAVEAVKSAIRAKVLAWVAAIMVPVLLIAGGLGLLVLLIAALSTPPETKESLSQGCLPGADLSVTERQNYYARTIIGVAKSMNFGDDTDRATKIALMTVAQESGFKNYANDGFWTAERDKAVTFEQVLAVGAASKLIPHDALGSDNDSVGLFQQRPFAGWAAYPGQTPLLDVSKHVGRIMNPVWSSQVFYLHLKDVPGWQEMSLGQAAQKVQVSAFPDAYAKHEALADALLAANADAPAVELLPTVLDTSALDPIEEVGGDGPIFLCGPSHVEGSAAAVIEAARTQVGLPYSWGAGELTGPGLGCGCSPYPSDASVTGFDCSGLTRYAIYQGTNVLMGRTSREQYASAAAWGFEQVTYTGTEALQAGDLVFFSRTSDPKNIFHVALATGEGTYVEAMNHAFGVLEGPTWTAEFMWVVRPPYEQLGEQE